MRLQLKSMGQLYKRIKKQKCETHIFDKILKILYFIKK